MFFCIFVGYGDWLVESACSLFVRAVSTLVCCCSRTRSVGLCVLRVHRRRDDGARHRGAQSDADRRQDFARAGLSLCVQSCVVVCERCCLYVRSSLAGGVVVVVVFSIFDQRKVTTQIIVGV